MRFDKEILKGMKIGFGFILIIGLLLGLVYAGTHLASQIIPGTFLGNFIFQGNTTFDGTINYTNTNFTGLNNTIFKKTTCTLNNVTVTGSPVWVSRTWAGSDCTSGLPSSYNYCYGAATQIDGSGVDRGIFRCTNTQGQIFASTNAQVILICNYLCWD